MAEVGHLLSELWQGKAEVNQGGYDEVQCDTQESVPGLPGSPQEG